MHRYTLKKVLTVFACAVLALLAAAGAVHAQSKININTASASQLQTLTGVGEVYAERIVEYREANGPFGAPEDIKDVKGIGDVTYEKNRDIIAVGDVDSSSGSGGEQDRNGESGSERNDRDDSKKSSGNSGYSSHASTAPVTEAEPRLELEVSAGRDRLAASGNEVLFRAVYEVSDGANTPEFVWSFGDGATKRGEDVSHRYYEKGTYTVVLNASVSDRDFEPEEADAVARTTVRVIEPKLSIEAATDSYVRIRNESREEVNLGGWKLYTNESAFTLPQDTIIAENASISVSKEVSGVSVPLGASVAIESPVGRKVAQRADQDFAQAQAAAPNTGTGTAAAADIQKIRDALVAIKTRAAEIVRERAALADGGGESQAASSQEGSGEPNTAGSSAIASAAGAFAESVGATSTPPDEESEPESAATTTPQSATTSSSTIIYRGEPAPGFFERIMEIFGR